MTKREFAKLPVAFQSIFNSTSILPKALNELTVEAAKPNQTMIVDMENMTTWGIRQYVKDNDTEYLIVNGDRGSKVIFVSEFKFYKIIVH